MMILEVELLGKENKKIKLDIEDIRDNNVVARNGLKPILIPISSFSSDTVKLIKTKLILERRNANV